MNRYVMVGTASLFFLVVGCEEQNYDKELIDAAADQANQEKEIERIARRIEGLDGRLEEIQQSLEKIAPPAGAPPAVEATEEDSSEPRVVEFKDAPEYKQIVGVLSAIQQNVNRARVSLDEARREAQARQQETQPVNPAEMMQVMRDPQELSSRLDVLAQNFAQRIEDPVKRQQFEAELYQLKRSLAENISPEQYNRQVLGDLTQRLQSEQSDRAREWIEREIQSLQSASGEELAGRLERYQRMQTFRQMRDLTTRYDIPRDVLTEAGLPAMGGEFRGGPGGRDSRGQGRR
jgi:hypothetical protein